MSENQWEQGESHVPVVETASGTTDPSNSRSGHSAYVITALAIGLMLLMGMGLSSCMGFVAEVAANSMEESGSYGGDTTWLYEDDGEGLDEDNFDFFEHLEDEVPDDNGLNTERVDDSFIPSDHAGEGEATSAKDVLAGEMAMYDTTIDSMLSAMSYANADSEVRNYVRSLVIEDRDASSKLHQKLRESAWADGDLTEAIANAQTVSSDTIDALKALEMPDVKNGSAKKAKRKMEQGRDAAVKRWEAISDELEMLSGKLDGEVDPDDVEQAEAAVSEATAQAAENLRDALSASRSL